MAMNTREKNKAGQRDSEHWGEGAAILNRLTRVRVESLTQSQLRSWVVGELQSGLGRESA